MEEFLVIWNPYHQILLASSESLTIVHQVHSENNRTSEISKRVVIATSFATDSANDVAILSSALQYAKDYVWVPVVRRGARGLLHDVDIMCFTRVKSSNM